MADHSLNALQAAARAMEEVVIPALDPEHPLAREQAHLVARYLALFSQRLDLIGARNRFELQRYLEIARDLRDDAHEVSPSIGDALDRAIADGMALRDEVSTLPSQWQAAARELAAVLTALVRTASTGASVHRRRIEERVLDGSRPLLEMQRAWFLPQGWELDSDALPPIQALLGPPP
jgi:hypothetical protein